MLEKFEKSIAYSFYTIFFFVPIVLFPRSSELFEFNKMVLTYAVTVIIIALWFTRMVINKKFLFKRTLLDIPLLIFLASQIISTVISFDFRTSLLGYYSRFNGGLMSSVSYALLYWAFVSNMNKRFTENVIRMTLISGFLVSVYGVLEHFGIDKDIWVQDVQNRVFSTLGQPNWLAAWLVALVPIIWSLALTSNFKLQTSKIQIKNVKYFIWVALSGLFFITLLYTKSRSGIIGFFAAFSLFWSLTFIKVGLDRINTIVVKKSIVTFIATLSSTALIALLVGTPWSPSIRELLKKPTITNLQSPISAEPEQARPSGPLLEVGGTESGEIRKIVWQGAIDIWKAYPIFGTGVETFAFSYYNFRPIEHNLVSEWDFLYNKAHNEYLNILATTGTVGMLAYLLVVFTFSAWTMLKIANGKSKLTRIPPFAPNSHETTSQSTEIRILVLALFSGYVSILITNFFGFSVVPVSLLFFLYPAFAVNLAGQGEKKKEQSKSTHSLESIQKLLIAFVLCATFYVLFAIGKYWYSDYLYSMGKAHNSAGNLAVSKEYLEKSVTFSPSEAIFWDELADAYANIALAFYDMDNKDEAEKAAKSSIVFSQKAVELSPKNVNLKRQRANIFVKVALIEPGYMVFARDTLLSAIELAPTDAKLYYNLGLAYGRLGDTDKAIEILEKTIEMKKNYDKPRLALALVLIELGEKEEAKKQLEYILSYINPTDPFTKQQLEDIK